MDENEALWCAVIKQAVDDVNDEDHRIRIAAQSWFYSESTHVGSLIWICENLDLDPSYFKKVLFKG